MAVRVRAKVLLIQGAKVSCWVESRMQSEPLILTPVPQERGGQHTSCDALLEPQSPNISAHALTDIDVVKATTTAMTNEKRMAYAGLYRMG